jgi:hypothetical protein
MNSPKMRPSMSIRMRNKSLLPNMKRTAREGRPSSALSRARSDVLFEKLLVGLSTARESLSNYDSSICAVTAVSDRVRSA